MLHEDLGIYGMLEPISRTNKFEKMKKHNFSKLWEFDEQNKADLYETLKSLIFNDMNTELVASELYLHRNSINYRKKKIIEILGYEPWKMPYLLNTIIFITSDYFN